MLLHKDNRSPLIHPLWFTRAVYLMIRWFNDVLRFSKLFPAALEIAYRLGSPDGRHHQPVVVQYNYSDGNRESAPSPSTLDIPPSSTAHAALRTTWSLTLMSDEQEAVLAAQLGHDAYLVRVCIGCPRPCDALTPVFSIGGHGFVTYSLNASLRYIQLNLRPCYI